MGDRFESDEIDFSDKRSIKRRHLIYYLRVFDRNTEKLVCHVIDVTPEGFKAISESPLENDQIFEFMMDLPSGVQGKTRIKFDAHSVWISKDANPDFFNTGFKIVEIDWEWRNLIERLIHDYGFNE